MFDYYSLRYVCFVSSIKHIIFFLSLDINQIILKSNHVFQDLVCFVWYDVIQFVFYLDHKFKNIW
jgi:hypothetical protein